MEVATSELLLCEAYDGETKEKSRRTGIRGEIAASSCASRNLFWILPQSIGMTIDTKVGLCKVPGSLD